MNLGDSLSNTDVESVDRVRDGNRWPGAMYKYQALPRCCAASFVAFLDSSLSNKTVLVCGATHTIVSVRFKTLTGIVKDLMKILTKRGYSHYRREVPRARHVRGDPCCRVSSRFGTHDRRSDAFLATVCCT